MRCWSDLPRDVRHARWCVGGLHQEYGRAAWQGFRPKRRSSGATHAVAAEHCRPVLALQALTEYESGMPRDAVARDVMGPDSDPTDEELAEVMREVQEVARQRWAAALTSMQERLDEAVREALGRQVPEPL